MQLLVLILCQSTHSVPPRSHKRTPGSGTGDISRGPFDKTLDQHQGFKGHQPQRTDTLRETLADN